MAARETDRGTEREKRVRKREGVRGTERELEFLLVHAPSRVPLALALIKPLRSRVYSTRKWREREGARDERREDRKAERKTLFSVVR